MLPSTHRLKLFSSRNFDKTKISRISGKEITLIFKEKPQIFKAAVVVTRKTAPKAVDRNRIKRITTEALADWVGRIEGELVVIVRKNIAHFKKQEVGTIIGRLVKKLR